ncbi:MAG: hypothetical protein ACYC6Y_04835 [Thermoguttaceae bacterium]
MVAEPAYAASLDRLRAKLDQVLAARIKSRPDDAAAAVEPKPKPKKKKKNP